MTKETHAILLHRSNTLLRFANTRLTRSDNRRLSSTCFFNTGKDSKPDTVQDKETQLDWPVLKQWDVPWGWRTASLTSFACGLRIVETAAIPYFGLKIEELSLDEKAEILFLDQGITTAVILGVLYGISNAFKPLPEDLYRYGKGWLLWAGIGLGGALLAVAAIYRKRGVLAPLFEENVFLGLFMASLTKWVATPIAVIISAAVFALAYLTP